MGANEASVPEETNFQHYKNEMLNLYQTCPNGRIAFDKRKNKLCMCGDGDFHCDDCLFYDKDRFLGCREKAFLWGLSKYEEPKSPYKITVFEYEFLKQAYNRRCTDIEVPESKSIILLTQKIGESSELTEPIGNDIFKLFSNFDNHRHNIKEILDNYEIITNNDE